MSAVPRPALQIAPMRASDLADIVSIEHMAYSHPWTYGNFADSLRAGHLCVTLRQGGELIGYFVATVAVPRQRQGFGSILLREALHLARAGGAREIFLEVRPGNVPALTLYTKLGFRRIAIRRDYYPAAQGREDAVVLALTL